MSKYSPRSAAWNAQRARILDRDSWQCCYCSKQLVGDDATVDHVVAVSMDPDRNYQDHELASSCRSCNSIKGARVLVRLPYRNSRWF